MQHYENSFASVLHSCRGRGRNLRFSGSADTPEDLHTANGEGKSTLTALSLLRLAFLIACVATWSGCTKQTKDEIANADNASPDRSLASNAGDSKPTANEAPLASGGEGDAVEPAPEKEIDYGDWLRLPEGLDRRFSEPYPTLVQSAMAGDPSGQMNLAVLSQQIASALARDGKIDEAFEFVLQSARAVRAGMPKGAELLPTTAVANIYFYEANALARIGKVPEAVSAIEDAVNHGFTDLTAIEMEPELAPVREWEGYAKRMETWQLAVKEQIMAIAKHDLEQGESFPFHFSGTDIKGNEQSLEALKGKVVIVDFWGTWCPPCRAEIPSFVQLQEKYGSQGFQMIGLNYERQESEEANLQGVLDFSSEFSINYPCLLSDEKTRSQVPRFGGFPTTLFIDRSGKVRMTAVGLHDYLYLDAVVSLLLAESE